MKLARVPLLAGLLPLVTVNICYALGAYLEHIPLCITYLDGCTSISSTGRGVPESMLFRAGMIPTAIFIMIFWRLSLEWVKALGDDDLKRNRFMVTTGVVAALFLIVYVVALGFSGDSFYLQRRIGVICFFGLTFLAQLMLTGRLWHLRRTQDLRFPGLIAKLKLGLCLGQFGIGLASIIATSTIADDKAISNVLEWNFALLMNSYFLVSFFAWRYTRFEALVAVSRKG